MDAASPQPSHIGAKPDLENEMFATNIAAMNAARKNFGAAWKESAFVEKVDGAWTVQIRQPIDRSNAWQACLTEASKTDVWTFPKASDFEVDTAALEAEAERIANAQAGESMLNGKLWVRLSSVERPVKRVWAIADEMIAAALAAGLPKPSRKEVQDECVARGIASGTARTQYQAWKKANDSAKANEAAAAEASKRFNSK
jgi:hypothetical protein